MISVTANVAPRRMHEMCAAALAGDVAKAREINNRLLGLHRHLFCEANPIPVKWAVQQMGLIKGGIRLPLTPLSRGVSRPGARGDAAGRHCRLSCKHVLRAMRISHANDSGAISLLELLGCVVAGAMLGACSSLDFEMPSKKVDYKSAGKLPPLEIPPDLTRPTADDRFAVPDVSPRALRRFRPIRRSASCARRRDRQRRVCCRSRTTRASSARARSAGWW